jgi:hypothetical protein
VTAILDDAVIVLVNETLSEGLYLSNTELNTIAGIGADFPEI